MLWKLNKLLLHGDKKCVSGSLACAYSPEHACAPRVLIPHGEALVSDFGCTCAYPPKHVVLWLAQVDSNHRPRAYQARALTTWAMSQYLSEIEHFAVLSPSWWRWWDSNPWPPACRAGALPAELHPHITKGPYSLFERSLKIEQQTVQKPYPYDYIRFPNIADSP